MKNKIIWFSGNLVNSEDALINVLSPTSQFGLNVFEGIRGYWSSRKGKMYIFRLHEHLNRLLESCKIIGIKCPYQVNELVEIVKKVVDSNKYKSDIAIRITVFVDGEGSWNCSEPVNMFVSPVEKPRMNVAMMNAQKACISSWQRINDNVMPPRIKLGANYLNGRYAHLQAKNSGFDLPILLNEYGKVAEGAGSCIFLVKNGNLITPSVTSSILEGITRDSVIKLARERGIVTIEREVDRTELYLADEVFFCGSAVELTTIGVIDQYTIGNGEAGELTKFLLKDYHLAVDGDLDKFKFWAHEL